MARKNFILVKIYKFTQKTFFISLLFFVFNYSLNAADWEQIATGTNFKEYFKDAVRVGRTASITSLRDYSSEMGTGEKKYLSEKKLFHFDCFKKKFRLTLLEKYEKNMLLGELFYASKTKSSWEEVSPNTVNEFALKKACKKK